MSSAQHTMAARMLMKWYMRSTILYGFGRAVTYDYEDTRKYWNNKHERYENKEKLVVDKISWVMSKSFSTIFVWHLMLGDDLTRLECHVRGKDYEEYK
jgi:hypothetical protein